jgi:hypothetical protein
MSSRHLAAIAWSDHRLRASSITTTRTRSIAGASCASSGSAKVPSRRRHASSGWA